MSLHCQENAFVVMPVIVLEKVKQNLQCPLVDTYAITASTKQIGIIDFFFVFVLSLMYQQASQ